MDYIRYLCTTVIVIGVCVDFVNGKKIKSSSDEGVSCFRKYRKKLDNCGGPIRRGSYQSADECCSTGHGFSLHAPHRISKNKYACVSCEEWRQMPHPKPDHRTLPPTTPSPVVETTAAVTTPPVEEEFACFRKFRQKRQECGGPVSKKNRVSSPEECCAAHSGFSLYGYNKVGKNKYTCMSCAEWMIQNTITTTVATPNTTAAPAEWGQWGDCSTSCGAGWQSRYRQCQNCDINHFKNSQSRPCILNYICPVDGSWGDWLPWQECTRSCDGGVRQRERRCNYPRPTHGGADCEGANIQEEVCNDDPCPVDGNWGLWSRFSQCSASCGPGTMSRTRECNRPSPAFGGAHCRGSRVNDRKCERRRCPLQGGWSSWLEWQECTITCGRGVITRRRECNDPSPKFGGRHCAGSDIDSGHCEKDTPCPVDGGWSEWSLYGRCQAADCSSGHQLRSRSCNSPRPRNRGRMCRGRSVERTVCFNQHGCASEDGDWCHWSSWSACTATCSTVEASQSRTRDCGCPSPQYGGNICNGDVLEVRDCPGVPPCESPTLELDLT